LRSAWGTRWWGDARGEAEQAEEEDARDAQDAQDAAP